MFWRREQRETSAEGGAPKPSDPESPPGSVRVEPHAPRPAAILRVAGELEQRGKKIVELFKEIETSRSRAVLPIHYLEDGEDCFAEVETGPWDGVATERVLSAAATLRSSAYSASVLDLFSAYQASRELSFLISRAPAALLQLDLLCAKADDPESLAEAFRKAAGRHWGVELDYGPECLPLTEDLLLTALNEDEKVGHPAPVLDSLIEGLGCYLGEVIRRGSHCPGAWQAAPEQGVEHVLGFDGLSLDPIGKARAFLSRGKEDSIFYYASYSLETLG